MSKEYTREFDSLKQEVQNVANYFMDMNGNKGDYVWRDENHRAIVRVDGNNTNYPDCLLYENKRLVGESPLYRAINFLYGKEVFDCNGRIIA